MKWLLTAFTAMALGLGAAHASDRVAVYALVDKVALEPNADKPERIQIWGVFAMARPNDRDYYEAPQRGYLYFKAPSGKEDLALKEWTDLKGIAGARKVVAFGNRSVMKARVRRSDEKPEAADVYEIDSGVVKVRSDTDYEPIRSLLEYSGR
ncbi:MAG: hypothetical protein JWO48_3369 [Bryobacterales bacterium]|nr:hypothetical protein [Bryobacterales bacterium]